MPEDEEAKGRNTDACRLLPGLPGRYQDRGVLAGGGMGRVFRAYDQQLERDVVIKVLKLEGADAGAMQERLLREAKTLACLNHRNIVKLLTCGIEGSGNVYLVMEYLSGAPLSAEIGGGKVLSLQRFKEIFPPPAGCP
jgi:serine/threonine protein kinase